MYNFIFITNSFNNIIEVNDNNNCSNNNIWDQIQYDISNYFTIHSNNEYNFYIVSIKLRKSKIKSIFTNIIDNSHKIMRTTFNYNKTKKYQL